MKNRPIIHITDQITVEVAAYSMNSEGTRFAASFIFEYPRFIHAELMTHRVFSRNAASSRAVPVKTLVDMVYNRPAMPTHWGKNQPGMSASEECNNPVEVLPNVFLPREQAWQYGASFAGNLALAFDAAGYHKQIVNRLTEPFQRFRVMVTTTELDNFLHLRYHKDAQPEIQKVAQGVANLLQYVDDGLEMALGVAEAEILYPGEWHTPYVEHERDENGSLLYYVEEEDEYSSSVKKYLTLQEALKISSSCSAQISYRKLDDSLEKAINVYDRLVESKPVHASPFEHQCTPMEIFKVEMNFNDHKGDDIISALFQHPGVTHVDKYGNVWSGNYRGFIQHRQMIEGHVCNSYVPH